MRELLLNLAEYDRRLTAELGDTHPTVLEQRETNARELELVVDEDGWPTIAEAGEEATQAALRIALPAATRPASHRRGLTMRRPAARRGGLPAEQVAELEAVLGG